VSGLSFLVLLALTEAALSPAYVIAESDAGFLHWEDPVVRVRIQQDGSDDISDDSDIEATIGAFSAWNDVSCAAIQVAFDGLTSSALAGDDLGAADGVNLVVWREDTEAWIAAGNSPLYYALTTLSFDRRTGRILDADIEVNGAFHTYTTADDLVSIDIRNVLTHEAGHVFGLDHSLSSDATMYRKASAGETKKRDLSADDREALCFLYPIASDPPWLGQGSATSSGCAIAEGLRAPGDFTFGLWALFLGLTLGAGLARHRARSRERES
jgi:Matrixin